MVSVDFANKSMFLLDSNFIWYKLLQFDMQVRLKKGDFYK